MKVRGDNRLALFFEGQGVHLICLAALLTMMVPAWRHPLMDVGELWGLNSRQWFKFTIANAIAHQVWVWLWWRAELHYRLASRIFGKFAFEVYAVPFFLMLGLRQVLAFALAAANHGTVSILPAFSLGVSVALALPVLYLGYSIRKYFGFARAAGADHFDESFRIRPLVDDGIFRYTSNPMYVFGFLLLWIPAIYFASFAAFVSALFCHLYIWVHFLATERPDMRRIYRS